MKKILLFLSLFFMIFSLTGCFNSPKVDRSIQRSKEEVISFVKKDIKSKYSNVKVTLKDVDTFKVQHGVCINACGKNTVVKGANAYTFLLEDNNGNIAYARYLDGYIDGKEKYDNEYFETYQYFIDQKDDLTNHAKLIKSYYGKEILKRHYQVDYMEDEFGLIEDYVKIIYHLDKNIQDLNYSDYVKLNSLGFDSRSIKGNSFSDKDPKIYVVFKDDNTLHNLYLYGLDNNQDYEKNYTELNNDFNDYFGIKSKVSNEITDEEMNKFLNVFNTKAYPYFQVNNFSSVDVHNQEIINVIIKGKTKNNCSFNVSVRFTKDNGVYKADTIYLNNEAVVRSWKID